MRLTDLIKNKPMKDYHFNVTVDIEIVTCAKSEKEARASLNADIADYFLNTEIEVSEEEAILIKVKKADY